MRILCIAGESLASLDRFEVRLATGPLAGAGLLVICGPTGAGKSTLLDALCLALYDRTPRLGGDSLAVVQKSAVTALAQVDFRDSQGQSWRAIWRARRAHRKLTGEWQPTQLELHNLDTGADHSSHRKKETLQRIEEKVGLGFEQFCRSVLLAQGDFARFLHETGKERARLLETITGGEIYSELSQLTFQHHKAARERLEQLEDEAAQGRVLSDAERAALREQHGQAVSKRARLEQQHAGYQALVEHYREIGEREREVATATAEQAAAAAALEQAAPVIATLGRWQQAERLRPLLVAQDEAIKTAHEAAAAVTATTHGCQLAAARIDLARQSEQQRDGQREQARAARQAAQPVLHKARGVEQERRAAAQAQATAQGALGAAQAVQRERQQALLGHQRLATQAEAAHQQALSYLAAHPELQVVHAQQQGLQRDLADLCQQQATLAELDRRRVALSPELQQGGVALAQAQQAVTTANQARQTAQARLDAEQEALRTLTASGAVSNTQQELSLLGLLRGPLDAGGRLLVAQAERRQQAEQLKGQLVADEQAVQAQRTAEQVAATQHAQLTATRAGLDADLRIAQAAADLATRRPELLKPGRPCPLCGATEHPLAHPPTAQLGAEAALLAGLAAERVALEAALEASRLREREAAAEARAAQTRLAGTQEQGAQLGHKLAADDSQLQTLTAELERQQAALLAVQSPLADGMLPPGRAPLAPRHLAELATRLALRTTDRERFLAAHTAQQATVATAQAGCDRERLGWERLVQRAAQLQQAQAAFEQQRLQLEDKRATTAAAAEQARAAAAAQLGTHAPWHALLAADPAALQRVLTTGLAEFAAQLRVRDGAAQALGAATAEVRVATVAAGHASAECAQRLAELAQLEQVLADLLARRTQLLQALGATDPALDLERFAAALQAASEQADAAHQAAIAARMTAEREAAVASEALANAQRGDAVAQATQASRQSAVTAALAAAGFADRAEAAALLAVAPKEREQQQALVAARQRAEVEASSRLCDRAQRLQLHRDRDLSPWLRAIADPAGAATPPLSPSTVEQGRDQATAELQVVLDSLYILQVRLDEDEQRQREATQRQAERTAQAGLVKDWALLNELIGSADGAKFRLFAQSLTLETLLVYTNEHLRALRPRYSLRRRSEAADGRAAEASGAKTDLLPGLRNERLLDLEIVDHDMGAEVRDCATLSGGESFLVSLALALGLSSLSARNVQVESLFIDEGFGSLDRDTLDSALAVLEELQAHGQQIGIISHITELSERIAHRVLVEPQRAGRSTVRVQVGDLLPAPRRHARVA